jgi:tripartite-type tricarboxylate transporter receptor subunit TctC
MAVFYGCNAQVRRWIAATVAGLGLSLGVGGAQAQSAGAWPSKPIRMIVPSAPGSGPDIMARAIGQKLTEALGQAIVIDDKPGAGGIIGSEAAAKAPPDGYTLIMSNAGAHTVNPGLYAKLPYDPVKDFAPVTLIGSSPMVLVTHPSVAATSMKELIALAKAKPGELNFASGPSGAIPHLAGELFKAMAGINIVHIGYKGVGLAVTDVIGGRIQMMFPNASAALPQVKVGRLRAHAVSSANPSALAPGLPTVAESGLPGYECVAMYAVFLPAKTPAALVTRLNKEIVQVLNKPEIRERFLAASTEIVASTPQGLADTMKSEMTRMGKLIRDAGIRDE